MGDRRLRTIELFLLENLVRRILLLFLPLRDLVNLDAQVLNRTSQRINSGIHSRLPSHQLLHRFRVCIQRHLESLECFAICSTIRHTIDLHFLHQIRQVLDGLLHLRHSPLLPRLILRTQKVIQNFHQDLTALIPNVTIPALSLSR